MVAIPFGAFVLYRWSNARAVARLEASVRAKGEPLTLAELAERYSAIPEGENAASALVEIWSRDQPEYWTAFLRGVRPLPDRKPDKTDPHLPWFGSQARQISRTSSLAPESQLALKKLMGATQERRAAVRLALQRGSVRAPIEVSDGFSAVLPHLAEMKRDIQLFRLEALQSLEAGDVNGTIESLNVCLRIADQLNEDPFLIAHLVQLSGYESLLKTIELMISRTELTVAQRSQLRVLVSGIDLSSVLTRAFVGERATILSVFHNPTNFFRNMAPGDESEHDRSDGSYLLGIRIMGALGFSDLDQRLILETMENALELAKDPRTVPNRQLAILFEKAAAKAKGFPPRTFSSLFLTSLVPVGDRVAAVIALKNAALTVLAIEDYRAAHHGVRPLTLAEVAVGAAGDERLDPFAGLPLKFKTTSSSYVVYSLGSDLKDDGGKEKSPRGNQTDYDLTMVVER